MGGVRSVYSPRNKSASTSSPRQSRVGLPPANGRKTVPVRSLDVPESSSKRSSVSEEDISRIEKKIDSLFLKEDRGKLDHELRMKNEELQAALHELEETKNALKHMKRKWQMAQKTSERLDKENKAQAAQLVQIREELMERRRKSISIKRQALEEKDENIQDGEEAEEDETMGNLLLKQGLQREEKLIDEVNGLKRELERERADHEASIRDMLVAVKVAVGLKEEAEAELARIHSSSLNDSQDLVWTSLIRRWNGGTKRHSLLLWVQYKLTPYPSINVSNFTDDWRDGKAFCALVHGHRPDLVTRSQIQGDCVVLSTHLAEALQLDGVPETLFAVTPDWHKVMNVVFSLYRKFTEEE